MTSCSLPFALPIEHASSGMPRSVGAYIGSPTACIYIPLLFDMSNDGRMRDSRYLCVALLKRISAAAAGLTRANAGSETCLW